MDILKMDIISTDTINNSEKLSHFLHQIDNQTSIINEELKKEVSAVY